MPKQRPGMLKPRGAQLVALVPLEYGALKLGSISKPGARSLRSLDRIDSAADDRTRVNHTSFIESTE